MSVIEKMSIMGIRSFGPEDSNRQVIEFFKPLTLILGPNGSGKTTIIECLRYMTTGDPPPNSDRGGSFVLDPKFAGEQEVKGQVKLQFRDVLGKKVIVTRSLLASQAVKKITLKTLEGSITRYGANNEKIHLSSKCAEIDTEMIGSLGVSKAILNNVIFCHQEESNWPLSEGRALKQKFDEIFAATRYIKALEEIRSIRQKKMSEIKIYETEVESLKTNKRKAEEFQKELEKTETRLAACKDTVQDVNARLKPLNEKLRELQIKQNEIGALQASLEKNLDLIKKYEKDENDLRKAIKDLFTGDKEDLVYEMQNFNSVIEQKKNDLDKIKRETSVIEKSLQTDMKIKSQLLEELGKLKADHDHYKKLIARRDSKLKSLRQNLGLGDFGFDDEDEPLIESQVTSILQQLKQRNEASRKEFSNCKTKHESIESEIQNNIEKKHIEKAQKQQKLITSNEQMAKNKTAIRNIKEEISRIDSLSSQQDILEGDLKEAEVELSNLEGRVNVDDLRNQLSEKQNKRNGIESQLSALKLRTELNEKSISNEIQENKFKCNAAENAHNLIFRTRKSCGVCIRFLYSEFWLSGSTLREINELHKENQTRTEIDIVKKDISSKQEAINKTLNRHRETIVHLLQELPEDGIHEKLTTLMNSLNQKIQKMHKDLEKERGLLSSLETTKEFHKSQLLAKEETLSENQKKIFDVCGSQDYDYNITSLKNMIKELQDEKGALTGSLYLYNKYIEKLEKPRPCCPLCTRAFQAEEEAQSLIKDLQRKLQSVPATLDQKTKLIASKETILNQMLELKPIKEAASVLAEKEIPELKKKIEVVTADITKSTSKISELEEVLDDINSDLKTASNIIRDVIQIDQTQRDIERLTRNLTFLKSQIANKDLSRNVQQAVEEQNSFQREVKCIAQEIDLIQQKINDFREQVQVLKGRINDLKAKKIKMYTDLQKKSSLTEQHEALIKENSHLAETAKEAKSAMASLETQLNKLNKDKEAALKVKEQELEVIRSKIKEEDKEMEVLEDMSREIQKYIKGNKERKLVEHQNKLGDISSEIDKKKEAINKCSLKEKMLNEDIASQKLKYRDLEDNMKLIEIIEKIGQLREKCQTLKNKVGDCDIRSLLSNIDKLTKDVKLLTREHDEAVGRENVLKEKIRDWKKQLEDSMFKDAEKKHKDKCIELRTTQLVCEDLSKYYVALNKAIINYHQMKMCEINKIVKDLWLRTYAGNDIDYIEIQSNEDGECGLEKARRQYNYRVVMFKGDTATDMRGRCSAGQKVLASLIIRLALAETFCLNCGIMALDEPTTNLDRENISKLARALVEIVQSRSQQQNFQLIIITHDEDFIERLGRSNIVDYFYKVSKDANTFSKVSKLYISDIA